MWRSLFGAVVVLSLAGASSARAQASTVCKDGSTTASSGRGTCSGHGGIDASATKKAAAKATTVTCADGTTGTAGRGACSHHGGVKGSATANANAAANAAANTSVTPAAPVTIPPRTTATNTSSAPKPRTAQKVGSGGGEDNNPVGSIAQCKDGMYSHAQHRQGACSRHGGVSKWSTQ
jgi:hypothetical protein